MKTRFYQGLTDYKFLMFGLFALILLSRALSLETVDLIEPTESRYASIASHMTLSGDWLTPRVWRSGELVPYFSKPPAVFWLTSLSYSLFGIDEWSARLPSAIAFFIIVFCVWYFAYRLYNKEIALLSALICSTSGVLFFYGGAACIDVILSMFITLSMLAFALLKSKDFQSIPLEYLFYASLGLGFLTKGPVAFAIPFIALFSWSILARDFSWIKKLSIVRFVIVSIIVISPWFIAQEFVNPGFVKYFFINENIKRFLYRDFNSRYGGAHVYPYGAIWLSLLVCILPWIFVFLPVAKKLKRDFLVSHNWNLFVLCWGLSPAILFTFAKSLHMAYALPAAAPLAIFMASCFYLQRDSQKLSNVFNFTQKLNVVLVLISLLVSLIVFSYTENILKTLIILFFGFGILYLLRKSRDSNVMFAKTGFSFLVLYSVVLLQFSPLIADSKSSEEIFKVFAQEVGPGDRKATIVNIYNQAPYWLNDAWQNELDKPIQIDFEDLESVDSNLPKHLLIREKDAKKLSKHTMARLEWKAAAGEWIWYEQIIQ